MFELFSAYSQAAQLVVAAICLGLGGLLLAHEVHWRLRATRVTGTVIGVRETEPNMFSTVYRYVLPTGQSCEATSSIGSNSTKGRDTGRTVPLLVFPGRPDRVSEAGSILAGIFGAFFGLVGLWPLHAALSSGPVSWMTLAVLGVFVACIAWKIKGKLIQAAERGSLSDWQKARRAARAAELAAIPVRPIEEILDSLEARERRRKDRKSYRVVAPIITLAGVGLLVLAVHLLREVSQRESTGSRTTGEVVALQDDSTSTDSTTYHAVVRFNAAGDTIEFRDSVGSNPPGHHVGDQVTVLYRSQSPRDSAVIDRGAWNWLPAALVATFGLLLLFAALQFFRALRDADSSQS
jgi:hypothetical protein